MELLPLSWSILRVRHLFRTDIRLPCCPRHLLSQVVYLGHFDGTQINVSSWIWLILFRLGIERALANYCLFIPNCERSAAGKSRRLRRLVCAHIGEFSMPRVRRSTMDLLKKSTGCPSVDKRFRILGYGADGLELHSHCQSPGDYGLEIWSLLCYLGYHVRFARSLVSRTLTGCSAFIVQVYGAASAESQNNSAAQTLQGEIFSPTRRLPSLIRAIRPSHLHGWSRRSTILHSHLHLLCHSIPSLAP